MFKFLVIVICLRFVIWSLSFYFILSLSLFMSRILTNNPQSPAAFDGAAVRADLFD